MSLRPTLGDLNSIVCFKAVITGIEDTLGTDGAAAVFTQAGRARGRNLANQLGLVGKAPSPAELTQLLNEAIGENGTRLCRIDAVSKDDASITVDTSETVCSAGEPPGSARRCTFTLGAIWGALEAVYGQSFRPQQVGSVLAGDAHDSFRFAVA